ncbi:LamB/YcsF family protein [Marisediminicola senii]|uniref:LamB/YcsF family protein n=1 Tax=Marisediminicola senii TaxID=2711233 RepID=UPI0013EA31FC|nr:5-oxoprolinase subunit PxpA [Marisediminicola senii]
MATIDLNSDLGEGFGRWELGDDDAMLGIVTSANIACGFHAGDPRMIRRTVVAALERRVVIGAHVGYRDLAGFGRRAMDVDSDDLVADVIYQIGALRGLAHAAGGAVRYVKPHGALYNTIVHDERQARDVVAAIVALDPTLVVLGLAGSRFLGIAAAEGLTVRAEAFADRAYSPHGTLLSRREPGAVLHDPAEVAERMVHLVTHGSITAADGSDIAMRADSICVHGDSAGAVAMAAAVRDAVVRAGVQLRSFVADAGASTP